MKQETLSKGEIVSYKLRFPFNEFANLTTPKRNKPTPYEPTPSLISLGVRANNNQNVQSGYMNFCEPQFADKNQGVTSKKCNSSPIWLTQVYDLRKKYEQELAEMYLIIESMDDDLRQMIMAKKD